MHSNRVYYKIEGKVPKTENFCPGAEPGAPDAGSVRFGILIGKPMKPKKIYENPKFLPRGGVSRS